MPYLSWMEGTLLRRHRLGEPCLVGRDGDCAVALPAEPSVSRRHAAVLADEAGAWWLRDLESRNGTFLNGLPVGHPHGGRLQDGDELRLGEWVARYTVGFPGLDGACFIERVGDLFQEVQAAPRHSRALFLGLELLQRSTEALLREGLGAGTVQVLLEEALRLLHAERGFVVLLGADDTRTTAHRIGDVEDCRGLSRSVMDYVLEERTGVLSNAPLADPRFGGSSLLELHRGALICAPMELDGQLAGLVYLDRAAEGRPFTRFDLALFQAFVRQAALLLQFGRLAGRALGQAQVQGELLRLKTLNERLTERSGELLGEMDGCLRWLQAYGARAQDFHADLLRHQVERLAYLVDAAHQEVILEAPRERAAQATLEAFQDAVFPAWTSLLEVCRASLELQPAPSGQLWLAGPLGVQAVLGLVEPLFLGLAEGAVVKGSWEEDGGAWVLKLSFPLGVHAPVPTPWTLHALQDSGVLWRWSEQVLSLVFPRGLDALPEPPPLPLLGLVAEDYELLDLFRSVAEADQLGIFPLEAEPPLPPLPAFRYVVVDALSVPQPVACIQAYRRHPSFSTSPILVVRASEDLCPSLLAAGATDWLPEGFRWETLHHRLQVLKGHAELQERARAAERLDALRRMAGSLKHEINNPLAVISMQVELLQRKFPEEPKLRKIEDMVDRIRGLVQVLQKMREAPSEDYPGGTEILKLS